MCKLLWLSCQTPTPFSIPGIIPGKPEGTCRLADRGPWKPGNPSTDPFQTHPLNQALAPRGRVVVVRDGGGVVGAELEGLALAVVPRLRQAGLGEHVRLIYVIPGPVANLGLDSTCPPFN